MNYVNIPHSEHSVGSLWMVFVSVLRRKWLCPDRSPLKSLFWRARVLNQCWTRTNQSPSARVRWSTAGLWPLRTGTKPLHTDLNTHSVRTDRSPLCVSAYRRPSWCAWALRKTRRRMRRMRSPPVESRTCRMSWATAKHSTLMSGGHWALFSIKLLPERLDWKESVQTHSPYCSVYHVFDLMNNILIWILYNLIYKINCIIY